MYIKKVVIENYKCFDGQFKLVFNEGLNILVGDNEVGKSTIIEAINLALSGWICGRPLKTELSESLFNNQVVAAYLKSVNETKVPTSPPSITIELYCDFGSDALNEEFKGDKNSLKDKNETGIRFTIFFDEEKCNEYIQEVVNSNELLTSLPIEFCEYSWESFSRKPKIPRTIPIKSSLIDSSSFIYRNGSDVGASKIIHDKLSNEEEIKISQAHRKLKDAFSRDPSVKAINENIQQNISDKRVSLQIETSTKMSWESSLIPYLNDVPFQNVGKGEQCLVKTKLSLQKKKTQTSNVVLLEEPENHLSHTKLNELISYISNNSEGKQVVISTHSSFVANKLGLKNLVLLNKDEHSGKRKEFRITELNPETQEYFEKLSGYDTLRLILCRKAILVEGDSDELIVQKAYHKKYGILPIEKGIDVISVRSLAFKRFLDIARALKQETTVVTDNDGDYEHKVTENYKDYQGCENIKICADQNINLKTLEPQFVEANKDKLDILRGVLNISKQKYPTQQSISDYMEENKTSSALKIFNTAADISFPRYILEAIEENEEK